MSTFAPEQRVRVVGPPGSAQSGLVGTVVGVTTAGALWSHIAHPRIKRRAYGRTVLDKEASIATIKMADGRIRNIFMSDLEPADGQAVT